MKRAPIGSLIVVFFLLSSCSIHPQHSVRDLTCVSSEISMIYTFHVNRGSSACEPALDDLLGPGVASVVCSAALKNESTPIPVELEFDKRCTVREFQFAPHSISWVEVVDLPDGVEITNHITAQFEGIRVREIVIVTDA